MAGAKETSASWMRLATIASVLTAFVMVVMKAVAFVLTGSTAMLGSLLDSILDMSASVVNLFAVRYSLTDADEEHRFGHGKAESLGALAQAGLIAGSSVYLGIESIAQLRSPDPVEASNIGIIVMAISIGLTLGLVMFQRFVVARSGSVAISADLLHYSGDLAMNAGVILALVLSSHFGLHVADPVIGLLIALWLLRGAVKIAFSAFDQLMDRELPEDERTRIRQRHWRLMTFSLSMTCARDNPASTLSFSCMWNWTAASRSIAPMSLPTWSRWKCRIFTPAPTYSSISIRLARRISPN